MTKEELEVLCSSESESQLIDFKSQLYKDKNLQEQTRDKEIRRIIDWRAEFAKDVLAMANSNFESTAYIVLGVIDGKGNANEIIGIDDTPIDDAIYQQIFKGKINKSLNFVVKTIPNASHDGKPVQVVEISPNHDHQIYYLTRQIGVTPPNVVYRRRGSTTEIVTPEQLIAEAEETWNKLKNPQVEIEYRCPSQNGNENICLAFNLTCIQRPVRPKPVIHHQILSDANLYSRSVLPTLVKMNPAYNAASFAFSKQPSSDECVNSVVELMRHIHLQVIVSLDSKYCQAADKVTLKRSFDSESSTVIPHYKFGDVLLPFDEKDMLYRPTFRSHIDISAITDSTIKAGDYAYEDLFIRVEKDGISKFDLTAVATNANPVEYSGEVNLKLMNIELYQSSFLIIANTLKSLDDFDDWQRFFTEHYKAVLFQTADCRESCIKDFARSHFGYMVKEE